MAEPLDSALVDAYELIEANRIDEARALLAPLLEQYPDDADLWWVYSHAVDNPADAQKALERVVELDPNFTEATQLLGSAESPESDAITSPASEVPMSAGIKPIKPLAPPPEPDEPDAAELPDFDEYLDEELGEESFDGLEEEREASGTNWLLIGGILVALLVISAIVLSQALNNADEPPVETEVASELTITETVFAANSANATATVEPSATEIPATTTPEATATDIPPTVTPTAEVTATLEATATDVPPTDTPTATPEPTETPTIEPTEDPLSAVFDALPSSLDLSGNEPIILETAIGDTYVIEVCLANSTREDLVDSGLSTLASAPLETLDVDAIAVSIYDCESEVSLRVIGVPIEDALSFQAGDLDEAEFQLSWVVVG